ncbi:hypothetical protein [Streptomyces sp. S.PB5]|uniref:hypothetical protein n=1 Tax=Streptomyces sp. S.PB5 TaxID=3020844 RepID=UPI0025B071A2|nr:hypothetical protein [Streptomyces sp. S.PB5]MDN3029417.1 hypothetical protein [Streptomyces sp. S.PB5]
MAIATSSRTATSCTPSDPVDADVIRETYSVVLGTGGGVELLGERLLGHVHLLLFDVVDGMPRMRGEWQHAAEHVVAQTQEMLDAGVDLHGDLWGLAVQCRALLCVRQRLAPLERSGGGRGCRETA